MRKKRILYCSNHSQLMTGFGKTTKNLLSYLYSTDKYELFEYAAGYQWSNPELRTLPWEARGTLPDTQQEINELNKDPSKARNASYGEYFIERAVKEFQPDICFFVEDAWGVTFNTNKNFWGKIPSVLWVTQDSLPITNSGDADKTPYYWCWASFATEQFHKEGKTHVRTQYPPVDLNNFRILSDQEKAQIRAKHNIPQDVFIITQVCRNQLRKLFPNQIEAYSMFRRQNPTTKTILLLVTSFGEGWDIPKLAEQYGVPLDEIYAVYVSDECSEYAITKFQGNQLNCPWTGKERACHTINIVKGVSEEQLNEIYNITDVLSHPATSGGCELPLVEAAAAGKIILTVDYSFGQDIIGKNKAAFGMDWAKYTEIQTQFIKSSPFPSSIAKLLKKVSEFDKNKVKELGLASREWALNQYDSNKVCKQIDEFLDTIPLVDWENIKLENDQKKNDEFPFPEIQDENEFITCLYKNILLMDEPPNGEGRQNWLNQLKNGVSRQKVYEFFQNVARQENQKNQKQAINFEDLLDKNGNKRALLLLKESIGDCFISTSLFESFHQKYPNTDLYVMCDPKFNAVYQGNPHIHKLLPYITEAESELAMIGAGQEKGFFDYYFHTAINTQRVLSYLKS